MNAAFRLMPKLAALLTVVLIALASIVPHHAGAATDGQHHVKMAQAPDCVDNPIHNGMSAEVTDSRVTQLDEPPACCGATACGFDVAASGGVGSGLLDWSVQKAFDTTQYVASIAPTPLQRPPRPV